MALLLTMASKMTCAHGGRALPMGASARVFVGGAPAVTLGAPMGVAGCTNLGADVTSQATGGQHKVVAGFCLQAIATGGSSVRVTSGGLPLVTDASVVQGLPSGEKLALDAVQARVSVL